MDKKTLAFTAIVILLISIALNVFVNRYMQNKQIELIVNTVKIPAIMTIDMDAVVQQLLDKGHTSLEVLAYVDNINKAMKLRNVLLLDTKAAISIPDSFKLEHVTPAQLNAFLRDNGTDPSLPEQFQRNMEKASSLFQYPTRE